MAGRIGRLAHRVVTAAMPLVMTPEWRAWMLEKRAEGVSRDALLAELERRGLPRALAVHALVYHEREVPAEALTRLAARRGRHNELLVRMRRELEGAPEIARVDTPEASVFFRDYYRANRPVVFRDFARGWPALERWGLEALRERLGHHEVKVTRGRESDPACDANFAKLTQATTLGTYLEEVIALGSEPTNDLYMIANNRNAEDPELLEALLSDVRLPPGYFREEGHRGATSWWIGPAGTRTPMHHDTSNILFCQIVGSKRFTFVSPMRTELAEGGHRGFYAGRTADALGDIPHATVELEPGDGLFIPVGWWHEVEALTPSVNISFLNFTQPNAFTWFRPLS